LFGQRPFRRTGTRMIPKRPEIGVGAKSCHGW
jgi:hypothetical protein